MRKSVRLARPDRIFLSCAFQCVLTCVEYRKGLLYLIFYNIAFKSLRVDTWASIMWYWSAHNLFWQLSIDHNMDVQVAGQSRTQCPTDQKAIRLWAQDCLPATTLERFCISCPVVQMDGRVVAWPKLLGWITKYIIASYGALLEHMNSTPGAPL